VCLFPCGWSVWLADSSETKPNTIGPRRSLYFKQQRVARDELVTLFSEIISSQRGRALWSDQRGYMLVWGWELRAVASLVSRRRS